MAFLPIVFLSFSVFGLWSSHSVFTQTVAGGQSRKAYDEVLVLKNGQIVEGAITQDARGYEVQQKDRSRFLALYNHVLFKAENRHDAYLKMRLRMPKKSAENHFRLATWCYSNEIYADALTELQYVFQFDPDHRSARRLSRLIEEKLSPPVEGTFPAKKLTFDGFLQSELKSLAGLSPQSAKLYVSKIQLMLVRSCGNSGCHGERSELAFRLTKPKRRGNNRLVSERNLAQILRWIDPENPLKSTLLKIPLVSHGGKSRPIFEGSRGRKQYEILKKWIAMSAGSGDRKNRTSQSSEGVSRASRRDSSNVANGVRYTSPPAMQRVKDLRKVGKELASGKTNKRLDAFDPQVFNQRIRK